ncbi:MAG: hypothetical protein M1826_001825 [Phylliscum demangeonii]|nr:MAG: hypothetical protein M1826_001825 [Phylliscum demangeonii]
MHLSLFTAAAALSTLLPLITHAAPTPAPLGIRHNGVTLGYKKVSMKQLLSKYSKLNAWAAVNMDRESNPCRKCDMLLFSEKTRYSLAPWTNCLTAANCPANKLSIQLGQDFLPLPERKTTASLAGTPDSEQLAVGQKFGKGGVLNDRLVRNGVVNNVYGSGYVNGNAAAGGARHHSALGKVAGLAGARHVRVPAGEAGQHVGNLMYSGKTLAGAA